MILIFFRLFFFFVFFFPSDFDFDAKRKLALFFCLKKKKTIKQDRARLESFDRAITCEPEDFPDKREGLAADLR